MPVTKCDNGKWRIGNGPCMYKTKDSAEKAQQAMYAQQQNVLQNVTSNFSGLVRHDSMEGRDYVVAPMIMLVEGVHNGSNGPLYYPPEEIGKTPCVWNMKPVVVYHPQINGVGVSACDPDIATNHKIGVIMNTHFEDGKLKAEAWLEVDRCNAVDKRILEALDNGEMMELSTGLFTDNEYSEGVWNGEDYEAVVRNFRPDHLALLPDLKGACSISDGAGFLRLNQGSGKDKGMDKILAAIIARLQMYGDSPETNIEESIANKYAEKIVENVTNQMSHDNIRGQLQREINDRNNTQEFVWILDVYEGFFVYEFQGKLWMLNYTKDNDTIALEGEPVEVVQITEYRRVDDGSFVGNQNRDSLTRNEERNKEMDRTEQIDQLIKNGAWTEDDRQFLLDMDEAQFGKIMKMNEGPAEEPPAGEEPIVDKEAPVEEEPTGNEEPKTLEQYIADAPPEIAEVLRNSVNLLENQKNELVTKLLANENNLFTKEQLNSKQLPELQQLMALAGSPTPPAPVAGAQVIPNYKGQCDPAPSVNATMEEPLGLPTMNFEMETAKV